MPSRRAVLGAAGTVGLGGSALGLAATTHVDAPDRASPPPTTWPLERFDAANAAANPGASFPADPAVAWTRRALGLTVDASLVVGPDAVYASDVTYTDSITAIDRADGSVQWAHEPFGGRLALVDGILVAAAETTRTGPEVRAFETTDGTEEWHADRRTAGVDHVVATGDTVFVGGDGVVDAFSRKSGARRWRSEGPAKSPTGLTVGSRRLYGTIGERLVRFRRRSWLQAGLGHSPSVAWHTRPINEAQVPALADGRLVVAATVRTNQVPGSTSRPALAAYDAETGDRIWATRRTDSLANPPGHSVFHARYPAVVDDLVAVSTRYGGEFRSSEGTWPGDHPAPDAVLGLSLADGSVRWRYPVETHVRDVAAIGDAVVVGTGTPNGGALVALDQADGHERWRREFDHGVTAVAPVDGAVFAVTVDGSVVGIR